MYEKEEEYPDKVSNYIRKYVINNIVKPECKDAISFMKSSFPDARIRSKEDSVNAFTIYMIGNYTAQEYIDAISEKYRFVQSNKYSYLIYESTDGQYTLMPLASMGRYNEGELFYSSDDLDDVYPVIGLQINFTALDEIDWSK